MKIIDLKNRKEKLNQREFAKEVGVFRTTLQSWGKRMDKITVVSASGIIDRTLPTIPLFRPRILEGRLTKYLVIP